MNNPPILKDKDKKKKKPTLKKLRNACDKKMQEVGKQKFPKSLISGLPTQVMHHFFPKSVSSFHRYNWDNLIPLTNGEHMRLHQSGDPQYEHKIIEIKGQKWYDELERTKRSYLKVNREYYENTLKSLEAQGIC
jgi:hypothetical protein